MSLPQKPEMEVNVMSAEEAKKTPFEVIPMKEKRPKDEEEEPPPEREVATIPEVRCPEADFKKSLLIHHINVGSGDATFIRTPKGLSILVDAGPWAEPNQVALTLKQCYQVETLDFLILTSNYNREIGGVESIRKAIQIKNRYDIDKFKPPLHKDVIKNADGVRLQFHQNKKSLALTIRWGQFDYYIGGDDVDEAKIAPLIGDVDVLRANQHGNEAANSSAFVHSLRPEHVVISRGDPIDGNHQLSQRLGRTPSIRHVFQTPTDGDVIVHAGKESFQINGRDYNTDATDAENLLNEALAIDETSVQTKLIATPHSRKGRKAAPVKSSVEEDPALSEPVVIDEEY